MKISKLIPADKEFLIWLAGFVDGEGCISIHGLLPTIVIANTNEAVLQEIKSTLGAGGVYLGSKPKSAQHKQGYFYHIRGHDAISLAFSLYSYLRVKRPQADILISFPMAGARNQYASAEDLEKAAAVRQKQKLLQSAVRRLNKRGIAAS